MKIGVDLDGVLYDFVGEFKKFLRREHNVYLDLLNKPIHDYDIALSWGVAPQQYVYWYTDFVLRSGYSKGKLAAGGFDFLLSAKENGHSVHIITSRNTGTCSYKAMSDTIAWIGDHLPCADSITFTQNKYLINCDLYLDDSVSVLSDIQKHRPESTPVALTQTWNSDWKGKKVANLDEFDRLYVKKESTKTK